MVDRKEILDYLVKTQLIEKCVHYQTIRCNDQYLKEELVQELYLWACTYDLEKLSDAYENNHLNALCTRVIQSQWFSNRSAFHYTYRKKDRKTDEITKEVLQIPDETPEFGG